MNTKAILPCHVKCLSQRIFLWDKAYFIVVTAVLTLYLIPYTAIPSFAQEASSKNISSVRMDVAHSGLHCPILGPQLKEQIAKLEGAKNININSKDSYIEFEIPAANLPAESALIKMANDLGYPREDIKVTISKAETK